MAVPKRRTTRSKRDMRRANHDKVVAPNIIPCANCSEPTVAHRICAACGYYKGKQQTKSA
ncbi:MAG: 50S ribosomal protein L32 [Myxococcales bacterium]|nr:MAG: 50S ribosomal protein L32 [Myxococcales bacterium]